MGCPVADRVSTVRSGGTASSLSTTFSSPITAMWIGGTCVDIRPFPSFSTRQSVPVSATAKFTPESPASASKNFCRSTRRAVAVSASTSSVYTASRIFWPNRRAICCLFLWMAGMMMCEGVSPSSWMMYSPRSVSSDSTPFSQRKSFRCISSETIDFPFTSRVAPWSRRIARTIAFASSVVAAQCTFRPFATHFASSVSRSSGSFASARVRTEAARSRRAFHSAGSGNCAARLAMRPSIARRKFARRLGSRRAFDDEAWKFVAPVSGLTGPLPQEIGEVAGPDGGARGRERAADVEEARGVGGEGRRRAGRHDVGDLVGHHRSGDVGVADREGAPEAAALALPFERDDRDVRKLRQERLGLRREAHLPQAVAGGVPRDLLGTTTVRQAHAEDVDEELRQLVDARREGDGLRGLGRSLEKVRVMVLHHPGARSGLSDNGKGRWKEGHLSARHGPGLLVIAAVVCRLGAAGLVAGKDDADALAFQELDS